MDAETRRAIEMAERVGSEAAKHFAADAILRNRSPAFFMAAVDDYFATLRKHFLAKGADRKDTDVLLDHARQVLYQECPQIVAALQETPGRA